MIPILYPATETAFTSNGLGALVDCLSCTVTEERNSTYELAMTYPVSGLHAEYLAYGMLILAPHDDGDDWQPFQIYSVSSDIRGVLTVKAEHISYRLSQAASVPFIDASPVSAALTAILRTAPATGFSGWTDNDSRLRYTRYIPGIARELLLGKEGSLLAKYGGEFEFDKFTVKLHKSRGQNRGVRITYGKNLTGLTYDMNNQNLLEAVYPFWWDYTNLVQLTANQVSTGKLLFADPDNPPAYPRIQILDLSKEFETQPTVAELTEKAQEHLTKVAITTPEASINISFVPLNKTAEYGHLAPLETVKLCDTVTVVFPAIGLNVETKVVKTVYNVLAGRFASITLGTPRPTITDYI